MGLHWREALNDALHLVVCQGDSAAAALCRLWRSPKNWAAGVPVVSVRACDGHSPFRRRIHIAT